MLLEFTYLTKPELNIFDVDVEGGFLVSLPQLEGFLSGRLHQGFPLLADAPDARCDGFLTAYALVVVYQSCNVSE